MLLGTSRIKSNDLIREWETGLGRQEPDLSNKMRIVTFFFLLGNWCAKVQLYNTANISAGQCKRFVLFLTPGICTVLLCFKLSGQILSLACSACKGRAEAGAGTLHWLELVEVPMEMNWPCQAAGAFGSSSSEEAFGHCQSMSWI